MSCNPLVIPAAGYRVAISTRNLAYDLIPSLSRSLPVPIICVGNLTVGGTGKTPMVATLARHFQQAGRQPAILSRGYGRSNPRRPLALPPGAPAEDLEPARLGDEALMLKQMLPEIPLLLDGNRVRGARTAINLFAPDLLLMDDGFQHRRLRRNFNLVMVDGQRMFGNRRLLPAGPLREPLGALARADAVVINKADNLPPDFLSQAAPIFRCLPAARIFLAGYRIKAFRPAAGGPSISLRKLRQAASLSACAGLANNKYFFDRLRTAGLKLRETLAFRDHHAYGPNDLNRLDRLAGNGFLLTTGKDAVKLIRRARDGKRAGFLEKLLIVDIELEIRDEKRFFNLFSAFTNSDGRRPGGARA